MRENQINLKFTFIFILLFFLFATLPLLDKLEQDPNWQGLINWSQVGVLGHSLGGTTALLLGGASLNWNRIQAVCQGDRFIFNVSIFLQCRAKNLPPGNYNLRDSRIKGVVALNPVGSLLLGQEGMGEIEIPTLMAGGTQDFIAPFVDEQVHPFLWLNTKHKYLATLVGGNHVSSTSENNLAGVGDMFQSSSDLDKSYFKALSLGFLQAHIRNRSQDRSYLKAAYAREISKPELPLHLVNSLTPEQLELAYGDKPPIAPIPETIVTSTTRERNVLAEIEQTGVLKVAMRTDAAPFSYYQDNNWAGYCADYADALGKQLTEQLDTNSPIKAIIIPSSLSNRFELVEQEIVHFECGSNSIDSDRQEVSFSDPIFASGTRLLVNSSSIDKFDLDSNLVGLKLGVLDKTTTKQFLEENYPDAEITSFDGTQGRSEGIREIYNGQLDAFVSDEVLLTGELDRQNLNSENYQTIPKDPLTCEYYGMILPPNDPQWRNTINGFIRDRNSRQVFDKWLASHYAQAISDLDYCQNRRGL